VRWRAEPIVDRATLDGIIRLLMRIDANVQTLVDELDTDDGEEEEDDT